MRDRALFSVEWCNVVKSDLACLMRTSPKLDLERD